MTFPSIGKEITYVEEEFESPKKIIEELENSESDISKALNELSKFIDD